MINYFVFIGNGIIVYVFSSPVVCGIGSNFRKEKVAMKYSTHSILRKLCTSGEEESHEIKEKELKKSSNIEVNLIEQDSNT